MNVIRYGKPSMNNLPYKLGKVIFEQINNSPKIDREKRRKETLELEKKMFEARKKEEYGK